MNIMLTEFKWNEVKKKRNSRNNNCANDGLLKLYANSNNIALKKIFYFCFHWARILRAHAARLRPST